MNSIAFRRIAAISLLSLALSLTLEAQQQSAPRFDVTNYRIEADLDPANHYLRARAEVTFIPQDAMRIVTFELNGSLKVERVELVTQTAAVSSQAQPPERRTARARPSPQPEATPSAQTLNFVQDPIGGEAIGPNVRVDLGKVAPAGQPVTLRFVWGGALITPEGGPIPTKRLAYVGPEVSYLMYAARWFPFHDYAADRATADITINVPAGLEVTGSSDEMPTRQTVGNTLRYHFVHLQPALIGNIAAGPYLTRDLRLGNYELQFYVQPQSESQIAPFAEEIGRALQFYTQQYGAPAFGTRYVIAQTDDETLEAYSGPGILFLSSKLFNSPRQVATERLQREVAYQWWGHTVGLKSFDDAWISQGLAEWSAFALREATLTGAALEAAQRDLLERALLFEQSASILRAPSTLDDQSAAYQSIMFYKGAMVFRMLRETLGKERFDRLLRTFLERYRGRNAGIDDFEKLTDEIAGTDMRYFFARWVESTGVPEFSADYQIIRTRAGKFRTRGTVRENIDQIRLPVDVMLRYEGGTETKTLFIEDKSEDFDFETSGQPIEVIIDPNNKILRMSDELRVAVAARRGIELYREGQYAEAQNQLEEALKLDRSNSWIYYHLGLIFLEQRNYDRAIENFRAALDGNLKPSWIAVWAHIKLGNAYDAKGDRDRAVNEYNRAIQTGDNYDNAQAVARQYLATPYDPRSAQPQQGPHG